MKYIILAMALLFVGCHRVPLSCRSEFLYPIYLASQQVGTPDPSADSFLGQQIVVRWKIPYACFRNPVLLSVKIRFGNREIETVAVPIERRKGFWAYRLIDEDYWCKEGILSFQARLICLGEVIDEWRHYLWEEIIEIVPEPNN